MREDIVEQKETEEVAAEQGENEKQSHVEIVNEPEEAVTEEVVTEETNVEETIVEETAAEEVLQGEAKTEIGAQQTWKEELTQEEESTVQQETEQTPQKTEEEKKEGAQEETKTKEAPNVSEPEKKKKKSGKKKKRRNKRNKQQERTLKMVRIACVLGIIAFCFIPKREKPVVADEIVDEIETEDTTKELQIPTVKRAEKEINKHCKAYRSQVEQMAARYGIPQYTDLLMALMMQESGGKGLDIMQSSEGAFNTRYPRVPDGITDVTYSIECGVQELKEALVKAGAKGPDDIPRIEQALQAYNFGIRYLDFSEEKGVTEWNEEIAAEYAKMASNGRTRDEYDTKLMGKWDYGDQFYPEHVLRYYAIPVEQE